MNLIQPHCIRLHGPWEYRVLARSVIDPRGVVSEVSEDFANGPCGRITIPSDWSETLGIDFRGRVLYSRHFNRPTNLEASDRVELAFDRIGCSGTVTLNGVLLGPIPGDERPVRFAVQQLLQPRNLLLVELNCSAIPPCDTVDDCLPGRRPPCGLTGEVRLEIFSATG